jgi:hypothetical protein
LWGIFGCRGENSENLFHADIRRLRYVDRRRELALLVEKNQRKSARKRWVEADVFSSEKYFIKSIF